MFTSGPLVATFAKVHAAVECECCNWTTSIGPRHGLSTSYDQNAHRQVPDRADRPPPDLLLPWRDFRHRSGIQQHRGMVAVDSRRCPPSQGSAVLSSARGKFGLRICGLCFGAESAARRLRPADPAFAGLRDFREGQVRRLSSAQSVAQLAIRFESAPLVLHNLPKKKALKSSAFFHDVRILLRGRSGASLTALELLASFLGALL